MKQENLNEIRNIYLNIATGGEGPEVLSEEPKLTPYETSVRYLTAKINNAQSDWKSQYGTTIKQAKAAAPAKAVVPVKPKPFEYTKTNLGTKQFDEFKAGGGNASVGDSYDAATVIARGRAALKAKAAAETAPPAPAGTPPTTAPVTQRPAASGPVLSKLDGVEGTGIGAKFQKKAFNDTERTRYSSVAAQNAARTSAASAAPAAVTQPAAAGTQRPIPTNTSPIATSTADKIKGGLSNYQSQVKSGDVKGAEETGKSTFALANPKLAAAQAASSINKLKTESKVEQLNWPSIKTIRDIADAYTDIYEKHNDGNLANNYPPYDKVTRGDVIAGATGNDEMGGKKKKKKTKKAINSDFEMWVDGLLTEGYDLSNYTWNEVYEIYENATVLTEEEYEIYSLVLEHLLSNGYAETEHDANIIIENMSDKWVDVIIDEAYKGGPEFGMKYSKSKPLSGEKGDGSGYGPPEKFTKPDDKIEKPGTTVPPFKKGGYGRIMSNIPHGIGAHRDKIASKITTTTGGDPGAPTSQKMRTPDKKRISREIVRKKPQA